MFVTILGKGTFNLLRESRPLGLGPRGVAASYKRTYTPRHIYEVTLQLGILIDKTVNDELMYNPIVSK